MFVSIDRCRHHFLLEILHAKPGHYARTFANCNPCADTACTQSKITLMGGGIHILIYRQIDPQMEYFKFEVQSQPPSILLCLGTLCQSNMQLYPHSYICIIDNTTRNRHLCVGVFVNQPAYIVWIYIQDITHAGRYVKSSS
jgi:hypothetical protein